MFNAEYIPYTKYKQLLIYNSEIKLQHNIHIINTIIFKLLSVYQLNAYVSNNTSFNQPQPYNVTDKNRSSFRTAVHETKSIDPLAGGANDGGTGSVSSEDVTGISVSYTPDT